MIVSIIVAVAENNVIGRDNALIWNLPDDMKFFKTKTTGHHIITGRKNYISIPKKYRPLPNRTNIVLTHQKDFKEEGAVVAHSLENAIDIAEKKGEGEVFVIGGGQIYKECIDKGLANRIYLTQIHHRFDGDTFFPYPNFNEWELVFKEDHPSDEKHKYAFTFMIYQKK